jgi:hypothetical protein
MKDGLLGGVRLVASEVLLMGCFFCQGAALSFSAIFVNAKSAHS